MFISIPDQENNSEETKDTISEEEVQKEEEESVIEAEETNYQELYLQTKIDLDKLQLEFKEYKRKNENIEKELNQKFVSLVEKKSSEAASILKTKSEELEKKYKEEFEKKKDFIHENQLIEFVGLISQFENILKIEVQSDEVRNYLVGFQMFLTKFKNLLSDFHITEVVFKVGDTFNSDEMISIETEQVEDEKKNKILKVYSNAFKLKGRVIKLSEVLVGI